MKRTALSGLTALLTLLTCTTFATTKLPEPYILKDSKQIVIITTANWDASTGKMQRYTRQNISAPWKAAGKPTTVVVGKKGMGWAGDWKEYQLTGPYKKEGDEKAPAGVFELGPAFGFADKKSKTTKLYYLPIKASTVCVDDDNSRYYGRIVEMSKVKNKDWTRAETMRDHHEYQLGVVIGYNMGERMPGIGSCIFMHIWKKPNEGTMGCTAMSKEQMAGLMRWLQPRANPVLVQMPKAQYQAYRAKWNLPKM